MCDLFCLWAIQHPFLQFIGVFFRLQSKKRANYALIVPDTLPNCTCFFAQCAFRGGSEKEHFDIGATDAFTRKKTGNTYPLNNVTRV